MAAEKQTVGLKLDPELAAKFKELQGQAGSAQDFVETLLAAYAQAQEETDTLSPIYESVDLVELENYQPIDDFSNVKSDMPHFEVIHVIRLK